MKYPKICFWDIFYRVNYKNMCDANAVVLGKLLWVFFFLAPNIAVKVNASKRNFSFQLFSFGEKPCCWTHREEKIFKINWVTPAFLFRSEVLHHLLAASLLSNSQRSQIVALDLFLFLFISPFFFQARQIRNDILIYNWPGTRKDLLRKAVNRLQEQEKINIIGRKKHNLKKIKP